MKLTPLLLIVAAAPRAAGSVEEADGLLRLALKRTSGRKP